MHGSSADGPPCALTPVGRQLCFDLVVRLQLNAAVASVPLWVLDLVMRRVVPWLCRRVLALVEEIVSRPETEFRRRMDADVTGVYRQIREATRAGTAEGGEVVRLEECRICEDYFAFGSSSSNQWRQSTMRVGRCDVRRPGEDDSRQSAGVP